MGCRGVFSDLYYMKDILVVLLTPLLLLPLPIVGDSPESTCGYAVIILAVFWITEALPIAVTSILPAFLFPVLGILTVKATSQQYINDTNMLFVGGLIVAATIEHWDIHKRIALRILMLVGSEPRWLMLGLMLPTWFLSMWISNTATTAMMVPIANAILLQLKDTVKDVDIGSHDNKAMELDEITVKSNVNEKPKLDQTAEEPKKLDLDNIPDNVVQDGDDPAFRRLCKCLTLCIAYAANCGGIGSLTGTGPNLVLVGQLDKLYEEYNIASPITFANWMAFGIPTSFVLVLFVWLWLQLVFLRCKGCCSSTDKEKQDRVKNVIREQYRSLGPITFGQGAVMGHFILLAVLWITRDMGGEFGWGHLFKKSYVKDAVPAVLVSCLLFVFPSELPKICGNRGTGKREGLKPLMSWQAAVQKVPWGVVFLLGGGFAMAHAATESGLSKWVGEKLSVLDYLEPWVLNLVLCYIVAAMTEVTSNTATCTLMMPILANLAVHLQQNPLYLMFPTAIATSFAFMLPVATPPNAVIFSYGYVRVVDMATTGFVLNIVCVLVLIGSTETLGNSLFDFHNIPAEILASYNTTG